MPERADEPQFDSLADDLANGWYDEETGRYVIRVWVYDRHDEEPAEP